MKKMTKAILSVCAVLGLAGCSTFVEMDLTDYEKECIEKNEKSYRYELLKCRASPAYNNYEICVERAVLKVCYDQVPG